MGKGLGLQAGDKVVSVNGQPIGKSPRASLALFESLKAEGRFVVQIERNGKRLFLTYGTGK